MAGFLRSANGQGYVIYDGPNGQLSSPCLEVAIAPDDVTSVAEKEMNGRSESSFGSGMSCALQVPCMREHLAAATWALPFEFITARQSASLWLVMLW